MQNLQVESLFLYKRKSISTALNKLHHPENIGEKSGVTELCVGEYRLNTGPPERLTV